MENLQSLAIIYNHNKVSQRNVRAVAVFIKIKIHFAEKSLRPAGRWNIFRPACHQNETNSILVEREKQSHA